MANVTPDVVTGAFGFTGKYIAQRLLDQNRTVLNLTNRPDRPNPFGNKITCTPLCFDRADDLSRSLGGAETLYNTYWVRFRHGRSSFDQAIANTKTLFLAARRAGVRRIVHISVSNPSEESSLPYFLGKAVLERFLQELGVSYAIIRPTVVFGKEDILINNIAWVLRRMPIFGIPGAGKYRVQPIFVEDVARLCIHAGFSIDNSIIDAAGPEVFTFDELVHCIAAAVGSRSRIVRMPTSLALLATKLIGWYVGDVVLTRTEIKALMADLLISHQPPSGTSRFTDWLHAHAATVGTTYASELARHFR